jgi:hypothetical protein
MYSYEKKALHCEVMSNTLQTASKIAQKLANYQRESYFPTEKWEKDKRKLQEMIASLVEASKDL